MCGTYLRLSLELALAAGRSFHELYERVELGGDLLEIFLRGSFCHRSWEHLVKSVAAGPRSRPATLCLGLPLLLPVSVMRVAYLRVMVLVHIPLVVMSGRMASVPVVSLPVAIIALLMPIVIIGIEVLAFVPTTS